MSDLVVDAFLNLRAEFFDAAGNPIAFALRDKRNTQDDPFDEHLANTVLTRIPGTTCVKASGALTTPDMALVRDARCNDARAEDLKDDLDRVAAIEVKKLERTAAGKVAREKGLDFNTTPPCGHVQVYDSAGKPVVIRGFYLFVCLEAAAATDKRVLTALVLVDGDLLNDDFALYQSIVGARTKRINLGTYGDGADRVRPMLIFGNPLGVADLVARPTLVHPSADLARQEPRLRLVHELTRTKLAGGEARFYCYRLAGDVAAGHVATVLKDPFPVPKRGEKTQGRGRFRLPFSV
jgi:hypothetical protein